MQCIPCKLSYPGKGIVAKGFILSENPNEVVGGCPLGVGWCEVTIKSFIDSSTPLFRPYGHMKTIGDAASNHVAWVRDYVSVFILSYMT